MFYLFGLGVLLLIGSKSCSFPEAEPLDSQWAERTEEVFVKDEEEPPTGGSIVDLEELKFKYFFSTNQEGVEYYMFEPIPWTANCVMKFLFWQDSLSSADTLHLSTVPGNVGNAYYILVSIDSSGSTVVYNFEQQEETFNGVVNDNNTLCDGNPTYMTVESADTNTFNLGDTIYINKYVE